MGGNRTEPCRIELTPAELAVAIAALRYTAQERMVDLYNCRDDDVDAMVRTLDDVDTLRDGCAALAERLVAARSTQGGTDG